MASRWFVFWIACWTIAVIKDQHSAIIFLIFAGLTSDVVSNKIKKVMKHH